MDIIVHVNDYDYDNDMITIKRSRERNLTGKRRFFVFCRFNFAVPWTTSSPCLYILFKRSKTFS